MKKNVFIFGLISGLLITGMMLYAASRVYNNTMFESNDVLGYAAMIVAFSFIFVGIKNFRDRYNKGTISFGKAFKTGLYITLIASTMYVVAWLIDYYLFIPDFIDKYTTCVLREAKSGGASQLELDKKATEMTRFGEMYKNPLFVVLITYAEVFPVGLIVSLISAFILKRKAKDNNAKEITQL
jgi:hypothetical protein